MMLSTQVLSRRPFSHRTCLHLMTRILSCQGGNLPHCKQSADLRKEVKLSWKSPLDTYYGARGLRMQPKDIIIPQYKQDGVDPEKYGFIYQNRLMKKHLKFYAEGAVIASSVVVVLLVSKTVNEIMEFDSSEFSLYHPILLYPCTAGFFAVALVVILKCLKVGTRLKSIYKHRENEHDYLGVRYTSFFTWNTEQFTFSVSDCVNNEDKPFRTLGNIYIKNEKYHLIDEDFVVPEYFSILMGYTDMPRSVSNQTLNRRRRRNYDQQS